MSSVRCEVCIYYCLGPSSLKLFPRFWLLWFPRKSEKVKGCLHTKQKEKKKVVRIDGEVAKFEFKFTCKSFNNSYLDGTVKLWLGMVDQVKTYELTNINQYYKLFLQK